MSNKRSPSGAPTELSGVIAAFNPASNGADAVTLQSVPCPCLPGDIITVIPTPAIANLAWGPGACTVAGTALIPVTNPTAAPIDPIAQAFAFIIQRPTT